jgi:VWFA-related protein
MRSRLVVLTLATSLALPSVAQPQQRPMPQVGETIEVSIVNADVFVTDNAGNRVRGLTRDDFEVFDDGKRQPITNFAEYAEGVPAAEAGAVSLAADAAEAQPQRQKRTVILFIDLIALRPNRMQSVFNQLRATFRDLIQQGDAIVIARWTPRHRMEIVLPFTDDHARIDATLERLSRDRYVEPTDLAADAADERAFLQAGSALAATKGMHGTIGNSETVSADLGATRDFADMRAKTNSLESLMAAMSATEGQKALLMLTWKFGLNSGLDSGRTWRFNPSLGDPLWNTTPMAEALAKSANATASASTASIRRKSTATAPAAAKALPCN